MNLGVHSGSGRSGTCKGKDCDREVVSVVAPLAALLGRDV